MRSSAANAGIILKLNKQTLEVEVEDTFDGKLLDDLADDLPEGNCRFIVYSYKWARNDGRVQYPLLMVFFNPPQNVEMAMLATNTSRHLLDKFNVKIYEANDIDGLTDKWLQAQLLRTMR